MPGLPAIICDSNYGVEMTTYIAPLGSGLGDVIVTVPLLYKSIAQGETCLVARSPRQEGLTQAIPGLAGTIRETDLKDMQLGPLDRYLNLRTHRLQTDYVWGGPKFAADYPDYRVADILQVMAQDYGFDVDFRVQMPLWFEPRPDFGEKTVIVPGTTTASKTWPAKNWLTLIASLEKSGARVCMLGEPDRSAVVRELIASQVQWVPTPAIQEAINIISSARAVVSVDTGLMHISVQQGIPTVAFFQGYPIYYRDFANCLPLFSKPCPISCLQDLEDAAPNEKIEYEGFQWFDGTFGSCLAEPGTSCMESITPEMVMQKWQDACLQIAPL